MLEDKIEIPNELSKSEPFRRFLGEARKHSHTGSYFSIPASTDGQREEQFFVVYIHHGGEENLEQQRQGGFEIARISPLAYFRSMWTLFIACIFHPFNPAAIDLSTGRALTPEEAHANEEADDLD